MPRHKRGTRLGDLIGRIENFPFYHRNFEDAAWAMLQSTTAEGNIYGDRHNEDPIIHSLTGFCNEVAATTYLYDRPSTGIPGMPNAWHEGIFADFKARTIVPRGHDGFEVAYRESHLSRDMFPHGFCGDDTDSKMFDTDTFADCVQKC